jgi:hypothetical protein
LSRVLFAGIFSWPEAKKTAEDKWKCSKTTWDTTLKRTKNTSKKSYERKEMVK